MLAGQCAGVNTVQTVDVDGGHRRAIRHAAVGEALHPAGLAEQMLNLFFVEPVLGQIASPVFSWNVSCGAKASTKPIGWQREQLQVMA